MISRLDDNHNANEIYSTSDLGVSTALVSLDFQISSLDKSNPGRVVFVFDKSAKLTDIVDAYWAGTLQVDAKSFFETQKWLKSRIYNG